MTASSIAPIGRRHYAGIFLLCLGTLLLELSLTRVMSVALWYQTVDSKPRFGSTVGSRFRPTRQPPPSQSRAHSWNSKLRFDPFCGRVNQEYVPRDQLFEG
jgi:hypothetical protein